MYNQLFYKLLEPFLETCYVAYLKTAEERLDRALRIDAVSRGELGSFKILGRIHGFPNATAFKAEHTDNTIVTLRVNCKLTMEREEKSEAIISERKLLCALNNEFCVRLLYAFQDRKNLYMCTDFACYGNFETCLMEYTEDIEEDLLKLFAAQAVFALRYLHTCHVLHRGLRPASFMLYENGYLKLGDFVLAKRARGSCSTIVGYPGYQPPEMVRRLPYDCGVDWFSLGVTLYELMFRRLPFCEYAHGPEQRIRGVLENEIDMPEGYSELARDFVCRLLQKNVSKRLGCGDRGAIDVMKHKWFKGVEMMRIIFDRPWLGWMLPDDLNRAPIQQDDVEIPRSDQDCVNNDLFKDF